MNPDAVLEVVSMAALAVMMLSISPFAIGGVLLVFSLWRRSRQARRVAAPSPATTRAAIGWSSLSLSPRAA